MSQYVDVAQLNGNYKQVYGDSIQNLIPDVAKLVKQISFVGADKREGDKYHQPVSLTHENGFTYNGTGYNAFALNDHIAMTMKDAEVQGTELLLRSAISYGAAAKAATSIGAFKKVMSIVLENMMESATKRLEVGILYGQTGIGIADSSVNVDATNTTLTLLTASWASGIWAGSEGAQLQFYLLPSESLISSGADSIFTVSKVSTSARTITVTGTITGITALDSAVSSTGQASIYYRGAFGNEFAGMSKILQNTGTLFNINATSYNLWRGNTYSASGAVMNIGKVLSANALAVDRGLEEKTYMYCNPKTWANLNNDLAALRKFDGSYKKSKGDDGFESISYYAQNGEIEIVSHSCVKEGEAFMFPIKEVMRLGAQDVSFKTPGRGDEIFTQLANNAGYELRLYTEQAIFFQTPAKGVYINNIVNS
jgi:hypothetical protein